MSNNDLTPDAFWAAVAAMPEPEPVFYRLYHDADGNPLFYSMEDVPGTYIEITQQQFSQNLTNVKVRDGKIVIVTWVTTTKLEQDTTGTPCHPDNVAIVVSKDQPHQCWSRKTYEQN